jgi:hypothetical protein
VHERFFYRPLLESFRRSIDGPRPGRDPEATVELLGALGFDVRRPRTRSSPPGSSSRPTNHLGKVLGHVFPVMVSGARAPCVRTPTRRSFHHERVVAATAGRHGRLADRARNDTADGGGGLGPTFVAASSFARILLSPGHPSACSLLQ